MGTLEHYTTNTLSISGQEEVECVWTLLEMECVGTLGRGKLFLKIVFQEIGKSSFLKSFGSQRYPHILAD